MKRKIKFKTPTQKDILPFLSTPSDKFLGSLCLHSYYHLRISLGCSSHPFLLWLLLLVLLSILQSSVLCLTYLATCSHRTDSQAQTWRCGSGEDKSEVLCPWQGAHLQQFPPKDGPQRLGLRGFIMCRLLATNGFAQAVIMLLTGSVKNPL